MSFLGLVRKQGVGVWTKYKNKILQSMKDHSSSKLRYPFIQMSYHMESENVVPFERVQESTRIG